MSKPNLTIMGERQRADDAEKLLAGVQAAYRENVETMRAEYRQMKSHLEMRAVQAESAHSYAKRLLEDQTTKISMLRADLKRQEGISEHWKNLKEVADKESAYWKQCYQRARTKKTLNPRYEPS